MDEEDAIEVEILGPARDAEFVGFPFFEEIEGVEFFMFFVKFVRPSPLGGVAAKHFGVVLTSDGSFVGSILMKIPNLVHILVAYPNTVQGYTVASRFGWAMPWLVVRMWE